MWPFKKKKEQKKELGYVCELRIYLINGGELRCVVSCEKEDRPSQHHRDFHEWYNQEKLEMFTLESENFMAPVHKGRIADYTVQVRREREGDFPEK